MRHQIFINIVPQWLCFYFNSRETHIIFLNKRDFLTGNICLDQNILKRFFPTYTFL